MGQQQLLLIVLGVIIVGIAVLLGILIFKSSAIEQKRDMLISEGTTVANNALTYAKKPKELGGGHNSFIGWVIPSSLEKSANGSYEISSITSEKVEIIGTGNELVSGTDSVKVKFTVTRTGIQTIVIN